MYLLPGNRSLNAVEAYRGSGEKADVQSPRITWHPPLTAPPTLLPQEAISGNADL